MNKHFSNVTFGRQNIYNHYYLTGAKISSWGPKFSQESIAFSVLTPQYRQLLPQSHEPLWSTEDAMMRLLCNCGAAVMG